LLPARQKGYRPFLAPDRVADVRLLVQSQMVETKQEIRAALESARARTEELLAPL